jgi:acyl carrier protein
LDETQVSTEALLSDLGVDSLAAIKLVEELQVQFGIESASTDITSMSISVLASLVPGSGSTGFGADSTDDEASVTSASSSSFTLYTSVSSQNSNEDSRSKDQLLALIAEFAAIDATAIHEKADLESLGVDSLSLIELKSAFEEAYGI